jgi:hypothetical protein
VSLLHSPIHYTRWVGALMPEYDNPNTNAGEPVLPPSRFGAGYTVGDQQQAPPPSYPAPQSYPPPAGYPPPVSYPSASSGYPAAGGSLDDSLRYPDPTPQYPAAAPVPQYAVATPVVWGAPPQRTNSMAITALVCGLVFAPLGIVFGHIALSQINRTGEEGRGMAIAGLVLGYISVAFIVLYIIVIGAFVSSL